MQIMTIMIIIVIGSRIMISVSHTIIPVGVLIGHGITDVYIQRTGIHGIGVLHSILAILIIQIIGAIGILIQGMVMDIQTILVRL
jgi:hypothetical protein